MQQTDTQHDNCTHPTCLSQNYHNSPAIANNNNINHDIHNNNDQLQQMQHNNHLSNNYNSSSYYQIQQIIIPTNNNQRYFGTIKTIVPLIIINDHHPTSKYNMTINPIIIILTK